MLSKSEAVEVEKFVNVVTAVLEESKEKFQGTATLEVENMFVNVVTAVLGESKEKFQGTATLDVENMFECILRTPHDISDDVVDHSSEMREF